MIDVSKIMSGIEIVARKHNINLQHVRLWRWRARLATILFRAGSLVAGFDFSIEEWMDEDSAP